MPSLINLALLPRILLLRYVRSWPLFLRIEKVVTVSSAQLEADRDASRLKTSKIINDEPARAKIIASILVLECLVWLIESSLENNKFLYLPYNPKSGLFLFVGPKSAFETSDG